MSSGERDAFTGLITSLIVVWIFYARLSGQHAAGLYDGADGLMIWARAVLWLIVIGIGVAIAVTIVFSVIYSVLSGEGKLFDLRDERDRLIEVRGMRIGTVVVSVGIVAAVMDLAWGGASALRAFNIILIGCSASEIIKDGFKIVCYRRGF